MTEEINFKNNPLHGLSLKNLLIEMVDHYGFEILFAYLNINCFKTNPSIESSVKFLKKTDWACEKVEAFYMYQFKSLPKVSSSQFEVPPRDRIVPEGQTVGEPAELSLEDAEHQRELRAKKASEYKSSGSYSQGKRYGSSTGSNKPQRSSPRPASSSNTERSSNSDSDSHSGGNSDVNTGSTDANPWGGWKKK